MSTYKYKELYEYIESERNRVGDTAFVTSRECNRLREMWCASVFAEGYEKNFSECYIEIAESDEQRDFDFLFHAQGQVHPFQVTEVLDKGRKRNLEYKLGIDGLASADGLQVPENAHKRLQEAIELKIQKNYAGSKELHLLLYANFIGKNASWATMVSCLSEQCKSFASVWIITGNEICCISSGISLYGKSQWLKVQGLKGSN